MNTKTIQIHIFITSKQETKLQPAKSLPIFTAKYILSLTNKHHGYQVQCHRKEEPTQSKQTSQVLCPSERMYVQS